MTDRFSAHNASLSSPASGGFAVTPSDSADLPEVTRALYVGSGGDLSLVMLSGETLAFSSVPDGVVLPLRVRRVRATGTVADDIIGLV